MRLNGEHAAKKPTSNGGKSEPPKPIGFRPLSFQARQTERAKFDSRGIFLVIPVMKQGRTTDHQRRNGGEKRLVRSVNCYYVTPLAPSRSIDHINAATKDFVEIFSGNYRPHLPRSVIFGSQSQSLPSSLASSAQFNYDLLRR